MVELEGEMQADARAEPDAGRGDDREHVPAHPDRRVHVQSRLLRRVFRGVAAPGQAGSVTFGPIVQKELSDFLGTDSVHTLNLFLTHDVGPDGSPATGLAYAWQSLLYVDPHLSPAVEFYGAIERLLRMPGVSTGRRPWPGRSLVGAVSLAPWGTLKYQVGYLFGLTSASPRGAVRWQLEYELAF